MIHDAHEGALIGAK